MILGTAAQAAAEVGAVIPRWRRGRFVDLPDPARAAANRSRCPKCNRVCGYLASSGSEKISNRFFGVMRIARTEAELVAACLVDGPRRHAARGWTAEEIVAAASAVRDVLVAQRWRRWVVALDAASSASPQDVQQEQIGLMLDSLRWALSIAIPADSARVGKLREDPRAVADRALDALVASSAVFWPTPPPAGTWG